MALLNEIDETDDGQMFIAMAYYEGETLLGYEPNSYKKRKHKNRPPNSW